MRRLGRRRRRGLPEASRSPSTSTVGAPGVTAVEREFHGARLALTLLDVENFGVAVDSSGDTAVLLRHLERQLSAYLEEESKVQRCGHPADTRVDAVLYFVDASGGTLRELDRAALEGLAALTNVIPVLAKADCYTPEELARARAAVRRGIEEAKIPVFDFCLGQDDGDGHQHEHEHEHERLQAMLPFRVVGADPAVSPRVGRECGRSFLPVEDPAVSDLEALRRILFR